MKDVIDWRDLCDQVLTLQEKNANQREIIASLRSELKAAQDSLAKLEAKPVFEVGKCYRNKRGEVIGPLTIGPNASRPLMAHNRDYNCDGEYYDNRDSDRDLLPPAVDPIPTWTPPASMPPGEYLVGPSHVEGALKCGRLDLSHSMNWVDCYPPRTYSDWTDPPKVGRWRVENGTATWMG